MESARQRFLSAALIIALLAAALWLMPWWATVALAAVTAGLAGAELAVLGGAIGAAVPPVFVGAASAATAAAVVLPAVRELGLPADLVVPVLLVSAIGAGLLVLASGAPSPRVLARASLAMLGPAYVGLPLGAIAWVHAAFGPAAVTWLIVVMVASDSSQFFVGRALGQRKLAPRVSPAKTIEGAVAGIIAAGAIGVVLGRWALPHLSISMCAVLAVLLATFGIAGDLFESLLKRSAAVKDSSSLIPGHGGVLDRIDSYLFAGPVFYLFLRYVL